ncbi:hypothetical protein RCL1_001768 [Eukaryota sp. TZLM3-RCL]
MADYEATYAAHHQRHAFDGKRMRKPVTRKPVDYATGASLRMIWKFRRGEDRAGSLAALRPGSLTFKRLHSYLSNSRYPSAGVMLKYMHTCTNKDRVPIFSVTYTPDARKIFTGTHAGEITLWNGTQFNFETILAAHSCPIKCLTWTKTGVHLISSDSLGEVQYWQSNMNNLKRFRPHQEEIKEIAISHNSDKIVTASLDKSLQVIDFRECHVEKRFEGHHSDVVSVDWHSRFSLLISGSKDGTVRLWDPRTSEHLHTLFHHRSAVSGTKFNPHSEFNFVSIGVDTLAFSNDLRNLSKVNRTFRSHKKDISSIIFNPVISNVFVTGGSDGSMGFWHTERDAPLHFTEKAHDNVIHSMAFNPMGTVLVTGGHDHHTKIWSHQLPAEMTEVSTGYEE